MSLDFYTLTQTQMLHFPTHISSLSDDGAYKLHYMASPLRIIISNNLVTISICGN